MCDCRPLTVRLHHDGRHFSCPYCRRVNRHPFFDPFYIVNGHAYCYHCGHFMKIENPETLRDEG